MELYYGVEHNLPSSLDYPTGCSEFRQQKHRLGSPGIIKCSTFFLYTGKIIPMNFCTICRRNHLDRCKFRKVFGEGHTAIAKKVKEGIPMLTLNAMPTDDRSRMNT